MRALSIFFLCLSLLAAAVAASTLYVYRDPTYACHVSAFLDYPFPGNVLSSSGRLTAWPAMALQCTYALDTGRSVVLTQWAPAGIATIIAPVAFILALTFGRRSTMQAAVRRARLS